MNTLGARIKELRRKKGLTQEQLAQKLSFNRATLASWEINRALPDTDTLIQLADFFGVSVDFLLGRTQIPDIALKAGVVFKDGEVGKPEYISDECALEAARVIAKDGAVLSREEKSFLLNMIKAYIASAENEKRKNSGKKTK